MNQSIKGDTPSGPSRAQKTLIDLVSDSNIAELEITEADGKVRIVKADPAARGAGSAATYGRWRSCRAGGLARLLAAPAAAAP